MVKHAGRSPGKSGGRQGRGVMMGAVGRESGDPDRREKLRREAVCRPYPKPTLVVW